MMHSPRHPWLLAALAAGAGAVLLAACSSPPPAAPAPPAPAAPQPPAPPAAGATTPAPAPPPPVAGTPTPPAVRTVSAATNARAYRRDAAGHLYAQNAERIYKGMLQPNLYAVGVLDVDIDRQGHVTAVTWRRAPSHAPEVMAEIVRTVRAAAPYPLPSRMGGKVTYTDIWLWDKSGKFQLDTLTEGQL